MKSMWDAFVVNAPGFSLAGVIFLFTVRAVLQSEFKKLDAKYLPREIANIKFSEIEKHFDYIRDNPPKPARAHGAD